MVPEGSLPYPQVPATCLSLSWARSIQFTAACQTISPRPRPCEMLRNVVKFYGELLSPRPTPKLDDHTLSAVRYRLFNIFAAAIHIWRPFIHPHPEDAPCRGDKDPLITEYRTTVYKVYLF